jgi:hypothetical protein
MRRGGAKVSRCPAPVGPYDFLTAMVRNQLFPFRVGNIAEADLRPRKRTGEAKDQQCNFAKRTDLNRVKSAAYPSQRDRKQHGHGRSGAKVLSERVKSTPHQYLSCHTNPIGRQS